MSVLIFALSTNSPYDPNGGPSKVNTHVIVVLSITGEYLLVLAKKFYERVSAQVSSHASTVGSSTHTPKLRVSKAW